MGWQTKGNGQYYTRSRRENGRVVREYVGRGEVAQLIAQIDGLEREQQATERERNQIKQRERDALDKTAHDFYDQVETIVQTVLAEAGYHRHARGQWRKRRRRELPHVPIVENPMRQNPMKQSDFLKQSDLLGLSGQDDGLPLVQKLKRRMEQRNRQQTGGAVVIPTSISSGDGEKTAKDEAATAEDEAAEAATAEKAITGQDMETTQTTLVKKPVKKPEDTERQEAVRLLKRAQEGDEKTRPEIRKWLAARAPKGLQPAADFAREALLRAMCSTNILLEEDTRQQMRALHAQIAGESPSPLESLLVERIVTCWLHLHYYETLCAQSLKDQSLRQSEAHGRRIEQVHRRYLSAIKTLAQIRRLELPSVQVNIGQHQNIAEKQVNVGR